MSAGPAEAEIHWRNRAEWLARRVNLGWWWHRLSPVLVGVNLVGAAGLLLFRQMRWPLDLAAELLVFSWLVAAGWAWLRARARFYAHGEGLLRLETHLGWHNLLSTAAAGGASWPAPLKKSVSTLRLQWGPTTKPLAASAVVLLLGILLPVGSPLKRALPPPDQLPLPLQQAESWMETLKEQNVVEPATLENWQDRLRELSEKPAQEWYGQNGLEAAESLRDELSQQMDALGKNLQKASDQVGSLESLPTGADPAGLDVAMSQTLSNLQNGGLPLQKSLAQSLGSPLQLSKEQMQQLQQQLQNGANAMNGTGGHGLPRMGQGRSGNGQQSLSYWSHPGQGGAGGGGGTASMEYGPADAGLKASKSEGVSNKDLTHASLGDIVSEGSGGPPTPEPTADATTAGGAANVGTGGDAVFRQELTPQERAVLERYFK